MPIPVCSGGSWAFTAKATRHPCSSAPIPQPAPTLEEMNPSVLCLPEILSVSNQKARMSVFSFVRMCLGRAVLPLASCTKHSLLGDPMSVRERHHCARALPAWHCLLHCPVCSLSLGGHLDYTSSPALVRAMNNLLLLLLMVGR